MSENINHPLFFTAHEEAVLQLLQALYPQVNYTKLVFCVLCLELDILADQMSLNWFTILVIDFAGDLFGPPGQ